MDDQHSEDSHSSEQASCACCFDLDPVLVSPGVSNDVVVDQRELVVLVRREIEQFKTAAEVGCDACSFILKTLESPDFHAETEEEIIHLRLPIGQGNPEILLGSSHAETRIFVQMYTDNSQGEPWKHVQPFPEICEDHLSAQGLGFINACLRTCLESHEHCSQNIPTLPTRVIDISSVEQGYVRLVEAEDTEHGKYTALSYCWGSQASVKTEIENIEIMKSGIAVKDLPAAYQDAIALTRELGIGFIWIDALCIIQNSQEDWERECSKMAETYANAYLTIAAASSASVMEHFLRPDLKSPPHTTQEPRVIHRESMQSAKGPVLLKARTMWPTGAHWKWRDGADEQRHVEPLSTRGWTLQEKVLSTRLLSVSAMEMVWTCKERIFCECGSLLNYHREFGQTPLSQISKPHEAFNFWHKVVENYSKRKLTQVGDKLPAISAIAAIIQHRTGSDYVAGLWRDNVDQELLWYRPALSPVGTANSSYTSPSFSWASITGEVDYLCFRNGKYPYEKTSQVLELTSSTGPGAPLGRVSSSKLVIRGPLAMGYVERQPQHSISIRMGKKLLWFCVNLGSVLMWFHPDTALSKTVTVSDGVPETSSCRWSRAHNGGDLLEELESLDQKQPIGHAHHHLTDSREGDSGIRCWVMRLGGYHLRDGEMDYEYLVLGRSPSQPEFFERLGLGMMMSDDDAADKIFAQEKAATITIV
ncbi:Ff.00g004150.m01.CDS01 [Fusarium sp. VM40]|nr:Ff.00g004150.m01.CDS01 [Fusarium sp. VM40]